MKLIGPKCGDVEYIEGSRVPNNPWKPFKVSNLVKMFSMTTLMTRMNA